MASTYKQIKFRLLVATVFGLACLPNVASAWQFRDLDNVPATPVEEPKKEELIELIPTEATFASPDVEAPKETAELEQPAPTAKPKPIVIAPAPAADKKPEPVPDPTLTPSPEPVAMPELNAASTEKLAPIVDKKKPQDPMAAFGKVGGAKETDNDIFPATFNGVQPGTTTSSELAKEWGEPIRTIEQDDDVKILIYRIPSFKQIEVIVTDKTVTSVLIHFEKPVQSDSVAKELGVDGLVAVPIPDEYGEVLGQAYPERGMLFSFPEGSDTSDVAAILVEPISSEMFRMRAQHDFEHKYEKCLADLDQAIQLDPVDGDAHWLKAEYLDVVGRTRDGLKSVQKAIRIKPTHPGYRITRSRLYAKTNRLQSAIEELNAVIDELDLSNEQAARAHSVLGDLLAIGPDANHQEALKNHLKAIDFGGKCVTDRRFGVRRMAKHDLVSSHMSVARDIAMGNFQRQSEVVPKWLLRATELADEFLSEDKGDELLQMHIFRDTLASYSELQQGTFESAIAVEEALRTGRDLIARASSDAYKTQIERLLAETLLHAAKIHRSRGKHDSAMQFANNAVALLENTDDSWEQTAHDSYLEAQLNFVIGSVYAIRDQNHDEAAEWYTKARRAFVGSSFATPLYSKRGHGEMYVSMGLSFWEAGEQDKGVQLTQTGADLMKDAVESGSLQLKAMAVPYGNLAAMHAKMGRGGKSQEYAKLVAKLDQVVEKTKR